MIQATPTSISVVTDCSMRLCFVYGCDYYGYGYFTSSVPFFVRKTRAVYTHSHSLARLQVGVPLLRTHTGACLMRDVCTHVATHHQTSPTRRHSTQRRSHARVQRASPTKGRQCAPGWPGALPWAAGGCTLDLKQACCCAGCAPQSSHTCIQTASPTLDAVIPA
jgi:hypothetical protein